MKKDLVPGDAPTRYDKDVGQHEVENDASCLIPDPGTTIHSIRLQDPKGFPQVDARQDQLLDEEDRDLDPLSIAIRRLKIPRRVDPRSDRQHRSWRMHSYRIEDDHGEHPTPNPPADVDEV